MLRKMISRIYMFYANFVGCISVNFVNNNWKDSTQIIENYIQNIVRIKQTILVIRYYMFYANFMGCIFLNLVNNNWKDSTHKNIYHI